MQMKRAKFLILLLSMVIGAGLVNAASRTQPFSTRVVKAPRALIAGEKQTFTIEIRNNTRVPLTLSTHPGFRSTVYWTYPDGSSASTGVKGTTGKLIISSKIDPVTGEIICVSRSYSQSDFITLPPRGTTTLDVEVELPKECDTRTATVTIDFESEYDGRELGLTAWTGKARSLEVRLPVIQVRARI